MTITEAKRIIIKNKKWSEFKMTTAFFLLAVALLTCIARGTFSLEEEGNNYSYQPRYLHEEPETLEDYFYSEWYGAGWYYGSHYNNYNDYENRLTDQNY